MTRNFSKYPEPQPGVASAEQGLVLLDGPDGVAVAMTPHAAIQTAHSLLAAAEEARSQAPVPLSRPIQT